MTVLLRFASTVKARHRLNVELILIKLGLLLLQKMPHPILQPTSPPPLWHVRLLLGKMRRAEHVSNLQAIRLQRARMAPQLLQANPPGSSSRQQVVMAEQIVCRQRERAHLAGRSLSLPPAQQRTKKELCGVT